MSLKNPAQVLPQAGNAPHLSMPMLELLRPRQWVKNAFVLAPLVFSGMFLVPTTAARALLAMALFCLASSATYVLNDLLDFEKDRLHPKKKFSRPLAAGRISRAQAIVLLVTLYAVLAASLFAMPAVAGVILAYVLINVLYCLKLKHVPVVDLFCIASGFVLRVLAGSLAISAVLSSWMFLTTLCLALFLASIKRYQELREGSTGSRAVLEFYTLGLLERYGALASISAILFYGLFVATVRPALAPTTPFILFGMFRYWYLVERLGAGESPTDALWGDKVLALCVLAWVGGSMLAVAIG
jgi:4-hydroxybenzoate polyprenyltransferase